MSTLFTPSQLIGSRTAKGGFNNEDDIKDKFNNWQSDSDAQLWLNDIGYSLTNIKSLQATKLHGVKPDIKLEIKEKNNTIKVEHISIKLVSNLSRGFNQIDKRWVDDYVQMWTIPQQLSKLLKLFTGEIRHSKNNSRNEKRLYIDELSAAEQNAIFSFFSQKKSQVISDLFEGRTIKADWMMVTAKHQGNIHWKIRTMTSSLAIFSSGPVTLSPRGSLSIGKVTMQRKGGDNGRPSANMLQFKADPLLLF